MFFMIYSGFIKIHQCRKWARTRERTDLESVARFQICCVSCWSKC